MKTKRKQQGKGPSGKPNVSRNEHGKCVDCGGAMIWERAPAGHILTCGDCGGNLHR